jgi:RNA polymerase sigma-70 factor, ECF subfamily
VSSGRRDRTSPLTVVGGSLSVSRAAAGDRQLESGPQPGEHDLDWTILMGRAQAGDRDAYKRLLEGVTPYLRNLAIRRGCDPNEAEDAVQDILLTVHAVRQTYDPARPFGPWLATIAGRRIIDLLRRQRRLKWREAAFVSGPETFLARETNMDVETGRRQDLAAAVDSLPPGQRQAIRMLKLEEMSLKDAAAASGMSIAALKVATHRALKNLRAMLADRSGDQ